MKRSMLVLIAGVLFAAMPTLAGPLVIEQVSDGANWVAHADYEQFNSTQIGQLIWQALRDIGVQEKLDNFATVFSFHPLDDVQGVTIYGTGEEREKAVVLIDGKFDKEKLLALLRMNLHYGEIEYGDIVLYKWLHEEKKGEETKSHIMYGCFYGDDLVVMSAGLEAVKQAVDVFKGSAPNAASGVFSQAALDAKGAFLQVAAKGVGEMAEQEPKAAVFKQTNELGLAIGEVEGTFYIDLALTANSEEVAQNITKVLDGLIGFATLSMEKQPKLAALAKMLKLSCTGNTVQVSLESDPESVYEFLQEEWERKQSKQTQ